MEVSVVAATNRDLRGMVAKKEFREDLYYRLAAVQITVPRLNQRREDLPLLIRHFMERFAHEYNKPFRGLTRRAQVMLAKYPWPGNIRELQNVLSHACMMAEHEMVDVPDLPEQLHLRHPPSDNEDVAIPLAEMERRHVRRVLDFVGGNKSQAAAILGIGRATLYRMLEDAEDPGVTA